MVLVQLLVASVTVIDWLKSFTEMELSDLSEVNFA